MSTPVPDAVFRAFADAVRDRLMRREEVSIPDLGTFRVRHEPSRVAKDASGKQRLHPPRDEVVFEPAVPAASAPADHA